MCADSAFRKDKVNKGRDYIKEVNYKELITMATNKYNIVKKSGRWRAKSLEEVKIVALSVELNNLKGKLKLLKNLEAAGRGGGNKQIAKTSNGNGGENSNKKNKKDKKEHRRQKEEEAWKKVPQKCGESHKKKVNGKEYHFCFHHNTWMVHEGKDCRLQNHLEGASTIPDTAKTQMNPNHYGNSTISSNTNTIQSFQAILAKLLLEQERLA